VSLYKCFFAWEVIQTFLLFEKLIKKMTSINQTLGKLINPTQIETVVVDCLKDKSVVEVM